MTELEFLSRFQRHPNGVWTCIKSMKVNDPKAPFIIPPGASFRPGTLLLGNDLAAELDQMVAKHRSSATAKVADASDASPRSQ
jgi:hypothetical protein